MERRLTADHLITLNAVIDYNKYLGSPTYVWFDKGKVVIETPVGRTKEIEGKVKQGTIFGPKLCSIATDCVNSASQRNLALIRSIEIVSHIC